MINSKSPTKTQSRFESIPFPGDDALAYRPATDFGWLPWFFAAMCAFLVAGFGMPGIDPFGNQVHASPQSEPLELEYKPVGTLPEWTQVRHQENVASSNLVIESDFWHYEREAYDDLWRSALDAVARKLDEKIAVGAGKLVFVDRAMIKQKLLVPGHSYTHVYQTPVPVSLEPADGSLENQNLYLEWHRCFIELDFNDSFFEWAKIEYERKFVESRVRQTALVVLSGFSLLVVLFGFLKFNHRTQGVYAGRLQSLAIIAAIAVIIITLALSNSIVWL